MPPQTHTEYYLKKVSEYPTTELLQFLNDGIQQRGISSEREKEITYFSGQQDPEITVLDYMKYLTDKLEIDSVGILSAYIYLMRYLEATQIELTVFNVHRIIAIVFVATQKYIYDSYFSMTTYAGATSLQHHELKRLELFFYKGINWELYINPNELITLTEHFDDYLKSEPERKKENAPYQALYLEFHSERNTREKPLSIEWLDQNLGCRVKEINDSVADTQRYRIFTHWATKEPEKTPEVAQTPLITATDKTIPHP